LDASNPFGRRDGRSSTGAAAETRAASPSASDARRHTCRRRPENRGDAR
jgi:hypothetical protein